MSRAWRTAVLEGAGALLWWDLGTGRQGADVWDEARAAGWLGVAGDELLVPARQAALDAWRAAWWPASRIADLPPLDPRVLAARRALALAALDGVTDDDEAVPRVLRELAGLTTRLGALDGRLGEQVRELAADHGVDLETPDPFPAEEPAAPRTQAGAAPRQEEYALAAGASGPAGTALLEGADPVDPGAVPQGVADPLGDVTWRVDLVRGVDLTLAVTVPAAPVVGEPPHVPLRAVAGDVVVPLRRAGDAWSGTVPAPPELLAARPRYRLEVPGLTPVPDVDPHRLVEIAREVGP